MVKKKIMLGLMIGSSSGVGVFNRMMTNKLTIIKRPRFIVLPGIKVTSCLTVVLLICLETVLLSTVSNCAKTFYMHWNTTNSIFRIDNTDHIIDVNKGNTAFEYDQVHIICPSYELGTFDNETEKYIIYNVSKVEYETCRITNANPRIIAICDKPQKLMFITITFRPFTPQPGGLEFLPGNDYYFISTSSKDDLHRRIGGRCSTHNMKVVFKVCCAPLDEHNIGIQNNASGTINNNVNLFNNNNNNNNHHHIQPLSPHQPQQPTGVSINSNIEHTYNNNNNNNYNSNNNNRGQSPISSSSLPSSETGSESFSVSPPQLSAGGSGGDTNGGFNLLPTDDINTNASNIVQSTISWPSWSHPYSTPVTSTYSPHQYYPYQTTTISSRPNINNAKTNNHNYKNNIYNNSNFSPSHKPTKKTNEYDKHPNEVVKNEELTYNNNSSCHYKSSKQPLHIILVTLVILINLVEHCQNISINRCVATNTLESSSLISSSSSSSSSASSTTAPSKSSSLPLLAPTASLSSLATSSSSSLSSSSSSVSQSWPAPFLILPLSTTNSWCQR